MDKFAISRADGRSNVQVLLDLFQSGEAGQVYTYDELAAALDVGTDKTHDKQAARRVATAIYGRLLKEQSRALHNVPRVGYRLAEAHDHNRLAISRKMRADRQFEKGIQTLRHVRWSEFKDPEARKAHEGQLMVMSAIWSQTQALERRLKKLEDKVALTIGPSD